MQRKASEGTDGMNPSDFRKSGTFPQRHRISEQFPVVLTPSEQVSEEVSQPPTTILLASYRCSLRLEFGIQEGALQIQQAGLIMSTMSLLENPDYAQSRNIAKISLGEQIIGIRSSGQLCMSAHLVYAVEDLLWHLRCRSSTLTWSQETLWMTS